MQKITPFLWFDSHAEQAMQQYIASFDHAQIRSIQRYPDGLLEGPMAGKAGKVLTSIFELAGQQFMALDGGPLFKFTPAISFFVNCATAEECDHLWAKLSDGGSILMPYQAYPFSPKFGWLADAYGLSWQINLGERLQKIALMLMFVGKQHGKAEEALKFYMSLFADSHLETITHYETQDSGTAGTVKHARFNLAGQEFLAIDSNAEHNFTFTEALSLFVDCDSQAEVDHLWSALSADPAAEQCGWLKDKYGVSWQIIPSALTRLMSDPDPEKSGRVMQAMLQMKKIDIAGLERAYAG